MNRSFEKNTYAEGKNKNTTNGDKNLKKTTRMDFNE